jgi:hypothetical protein
MGRLGNTTGWAVVAILAVAPFLYGGTTERFIGYLNWSMLAVALLWIASLLVDRRYPRIPLLVTICVILILCQGWFMAFNAKSIIDREYLEQVAIKAVFPSLPGSMDAVGSRTMMIRVTALALLFFAVIDLGQSTRWVRRFLSVIAISGTAIAAFGVWQRSSPTPFAIWPEGTKPQLTAFATFWYHGNAATLLNLAWPSSLMGAIWSFRNPRSHLFRALWLASIGMILTGLIVNASKAGHIIAAFMAILFILVFLFRLRVLVSKHGWPQVIVYALLGFAAVGALLLHADGAFSVHRWREWYERPGFSDSRLTTASTILHTLPGMNLLGSGPGTFEGVFYRRAASVDQTPDVRWEFAHNDYLQYLVEYGWVGGFVWLTLWGYVLGQCIRQIWYMIRPALEMGEHRGRRSRQRWEHSFNAMRQYYLFGAAVTMIGVLLNAALDFPLQILSLQIYAFTIAGIIVSVPKSSLAAPHVLLPEEA